MNLRPVLIDQLGDGLQLDNDSAKTNEVRFVFLVERMTLVEQIEFRLRDEGNRLKAKLNPQALLINRLDKSTTFLVVHFEAGTHDSVRLFFVDDFHRSSLFLTDSCH